MPTCSWAMTSVPICCADRRAQGHPLILPETRPCSLAACKVTSLFPDELRLATSALLAALLWQQCNGCGLGRS